MSGKNKLVATDPVAQISSPEFLAEQDRSALDLVKIKRALALANAEKALAQNEVAELTYRNLILQLTFKYTLTEQDMITEQGEIVRGTEGKK